MQLSFPFVTNSSIEGCQKKLGGKGECIHLFYLQTNLNSINLMLDFMELLYEKLHLNSCIMYA